MIWCKEYDLCRSFEHFHNMKRLIPYFLAFAIIACQNNTSVNKKDYTAITNKEIDTNKIVLLQFHPGNFYLSDKSAKPTSVNRSECFLTQNILAQCINAMNDSTQNLKIYRIPYIDLNLYKQQYIPYINSNGDKIVWVNCLCDQNVSDWKKDIIIVRDGGSCYFHVEINLTRKNYGLLYVNGNA